MLFLWETPQWLPNCLHIKQIKMRNPRYRFPILIPQIFKCMYFNRGIHIFNREDLSYRMLKHLNENYFEITYLWKIFILSIDSLKIVFEDTVFLYIFMENIFENPEFVKGKAFVIFELFLLQRAFY
jgi:hypothetical protein